MKDAEIVAHETLLENATKVVKIAENKKDASLEANKATKLIQKISELKKLIAYLEEKIEKDEASLLQEPIQIFLKTTRQQIPRALLLLLGVISVPVFIKVFLYFIIAPLASRQPAIQILPESSGTIVIPPFESEGDDNKIRCSGVSQDIHLQKGDELLVHSDYLQSSSIDSLKNTQLFLNNNIPFSSIASGLILLSKVVAQAEERVVISSSKDPLSDIGIIEIPADSAIVCQPRCLVGVINKAASPVKITRHWRLFSLQSWLTLQLRYLVFHGPSKLILKGCRGVRVEQPDSPRLINQSATLGFSANLMYSNVRCETFVSYWTGKEDLFNDLFEGPSGSYIYEEMPDLNRKSGIMGRGLEGVLDAALKVFGI